MKKVEETTQVLQECIFPRSLLSAQDAQYAAKFILLLHDIAAGFSSLSIYDRVQFHNFFFFFHIFNLINFFLRFSQISLELFLL